MGACLSTTQNTPTTPLITISISSSNYTLSRSESTAFSIILSVSLEAERPVTFLTEKTVFSQDDAFNFEGFTFTDKDGVVTGGKSISDDPDGTQQ
jgi:hypothetical protein